MATQYANGQIVTNGLVLCLNAADKNSYPGSGTTWRDLSGNVYNGTLTNGPTYSSSNGGAISFDGTDDYIDVTSFNIDAGNAFTLEAFIKPNTVSGTQTIIKKNTSNDNWPIFQMVLSGANLYGYYSSIIYGQCLEGAYTTNNPITTNSWYYIAFSKGTGGYTTMKLFINGISVSYSNYLYGSHINTIASSTKPIYIGRDLDGPNWINPFNGLMPIARVYNIQLSDQEISQNYNAMKTRFGL